MMQWDYCDRRRGPAGDKPAFFDSIDALVEKTEPFWYDAYAGDTFLLRRKLKEAAEAFDPDLIFWPTYTDQLDSVTLDELGRRWPTCGWFGDDTWRFDSYSSKLAPHFTHVCTTDPFSVEKYRGIGVSPILTQWAAVPVSPAPTLPSLGEKYRFDISFVGGRNQVREWFVRRLERHGVKVECFGQGWPNGKISFSEMQTVFRGSKVNLNLSNSVPSDIRFVLSAPMNLARYLSSPKRAEQIKARNFEIPLAGGFQLANYVPGLERYLEVGREAAVYSTPAECAELARYYLQREVDRISQISAAHARSEREHTYLRRFERIFFDIWGEAAPS